MSYGYSAKTNIFYVIEDKEGYAEFGNWPDDVKSISDEIWEKFSVQGPPGKMRGAGKNGLPCWVDIPPPTREEQIEAAERKKAQLMAEAAKAIAPLQDADDLGMAMVEEKSALISWKTFRVKLNRIDTSVAPDIEWPEVPGVA
ncbi:MAG: tail fiber assembly protein [Enterobacterales bacterium endosymbiont of Blomia tropicalis]|uniref:tail fiber assembly protein n=1 Tax=Mixta mediterraneensis TaxID=2758443 RepID=UPI0025A8E6DC|nr:tail fiber assembly protein [Mixta mediterraneensis]MDL4913069.1 tail fiber assembly protein [Mixta mediterraneensis]